MSHDIWAWDISSHPLSTDTFGGAAQTFLALQEVNDGGSPRFAEFARALVARHPSADMLAPDDPDAEDSPWQGNPLKQAQDGQRALFGLSLPQGGDPLPLLRFVVEAANAAGLAVFDDQLGTAFLPDGRVLPEEHREAWATLKRQLDAEPEHLTKAQARKLLLSRLGDVLGKHGFELATRQGWHGAFVRPIEGGSQWISLYISGTGAALKGGLHFAVDFDAVKSIYKEVCGSDWSRGGSTHCRSPSRTSLWKLPTSSPSLPRPARSGRCRRWWKAVRCRFCSAAAPWASSTR
ncbi:hypothetical protein [Polaromonas hydrogenivorans]|uniref:Uncharacterized protein n=1 Tax=Polaromonas hydrogenivorans TaxID=335476 RepID=A0AAU7LVA7_9BURK